MPLRLALGDRFPLIERALSSCYSELDLRVWSFEIDGEWNERQTFFLYLADEFADLTSMEQKFPRSCRLVIADAAVRIWTDVHPDQPDLPVLHDGVTILKIRLTLSNRLYLGPCERDAGFIGLEDRIIVSCLSVGNHHARLRVGALPRGDGLVL